MIRKWLDKMAFPLVPIVCILLGFCTAALSIVGFFYISRGIERQKHLSFDAFYIEKIRSHASPALNKVAVIFTQFGSTLVLGLLLLISLAYLWFRRRDIWSMLFYLLTVAGGGVLNSILKHEYKRQRPNDNPVVEELSFSFPSGHAMGSMLYYGFLAYLIIRSERKWIHKVLSAIFFVCFIMAIGVSRIYLGVHYPSDVVAGYCAGLVWLLVCVGTLELIGWYKRRQRRTAS
ncbi:phosphoesterase PA-phosphatase-like protein [Fictibacillus macauensis ZFHKF-1]|uniref:Phosphoesterase PA-phosphatase-like protein n=1 Tax=Fictibacillus macauensis ZFHKF-1 TaxID=1196324 RepID=I8J270_9BACL|nr:phosphatase PAP2 family protein [Fictibacillus macauensis]EIT85841.1 phosphoesterase PA-phosphatase-like protein [Fictibacillus macauensis ZFHKF-1]